MDISGLLQPFIIIYNEFKFFFHIYVYKSLIGVPQLRARKILVSYPGVFIVNFELILQLFQVFVLLTLNR